MPCCNTKYVTVQSPPECTPIPKYKPCADCDHPDGYGLNECVTLCRKVGEENIEFIYVSLIANNTRHPELGSLDDPPVWKEVTWCTVVNKALRAFPNIPEIPSVCAFLADVPDNNSLIGG
jgi:hypothetical protein